MGSVSYSVLFLSVATDTRLSTTVSINIREAAMRTLIYNLIRLVACIKQNLEKILKLFQSQRV